MRFNVLTSWLLLGLGLHVLLALAFLAMPAAPFLDGLQASCADAFYLGMPLTDQAKAHHGHLLGMVGSVGSDEGVDKRPDRLVRRTHDGRLGLHLELRLLEIDELLHEIDVRLGRGHLGDSARRADHLRRATLDPEEPCVESEHGMKRRSGRAPVASVPKPRGLVVVDGRA